MEIIGKEELIEEIRKEKDNIILAYMNIDSNVDDESQTVAEGIRKEDLIDRINDLCDGKYITIIYRRYGIDVYRYSDDEYRIHKFEVTFINPE